MHPYKRADRLGHLIREVVSEIIMQRVKDPRLGFLTVTDAELTRDLRHAKIFISVLKAEERETTMEILKNASPMIRSELAHRVKMKIIPMIEFKLDTSAEYGSRIEGLLRDIKK